MINFNFRHGDLCWRTSGYDTDIDHRLVVVRSKIGPNNNIVLVVYLKYFISGKYYHLSILMKNLIFIKRDYDKERTKIEYKKEEGQVYEYKGSPAIALESLYVDESKIAINYLVGDNKVWIPVI